MPKHILCVTITLLNGSAHIINSRTHTGTGDFFRTDQEADAYLVGEGFTYDPATQEYDRS